MTVAVCLKCGEFKHGAFNPCQNCGHTPDDDESLTRHLLATDHYFNSEELQAISAKVKAGDHVEFSQEILKAAWVSKAQFDAETKKLGRGCALGCVMILAIGVTVCLMFVRRR